MKTIDVTRSSVRPRSSGFVLIIAIVMASILFSISVGIANFALKEIIITSTSRNSIFAFYAADSGIECLQYWDNIRGDDRASSTFASGQSSETWDDLMCNQTEITLVDPRPDVQEFNFSLSEIAPDPAQEDLRDASPIAHQRVRKEIDDPDDADTQIYQSILQSWGVNNNFVGNAKRVDRALKARYK